MAAVSDHPRLVAGDTVRLVFAGPSEDQVVWIARVSNPAGRDRSPVKLLRYMIEHKHWSPFEHVWMTVEISSSRALSPQFLRHKSFSFQEFSQRYAEVDGFHLYWGRRAGTTNRQSSTDDLHTDDQAWFQDAQREVAEFTYARYQEALSRGLATESARFLLGMSAETIVDMSGPMRSWIHYLEERCRDTTQFEHREIALAIKRIFSENFPITAAALRWIEDPQEDR